MTSGATLPMTNIGTERKCGMGALTIQRDNQKSNLPLAGLGVEAQVVDRVAQVTVNQKFHNPYSEHLEAVYIFPLAASAAVSKFVLKVGNRIITGKVDERAQARQQYAQAIQEGKRAALLEQERDDVFTVQVGNLPPGEEVTVEISYSERLPFFADGTTEIRLPLVVAPRYIPGAEVDRDSVGHGVQADTDIVPDASRISPPRLVPGFNPNVDLSIKVQLIPGDSNQNSGLADLSCSQHAVQTSIENGATMIELAREAERLDRDFVLRWRLAQEKISTEFVYVKDSEAATCYGMLSVLPPSRKQVQEKPRDVVFVLDRSGSMNGVKMVSAIRACSILLNTLNPSDRFAIQAYDTVVEWMPVKNAKAEYEFWSEPGAATSAMPSSKFFIQADESGLLKGEAYLRTINARGGTETGLALKEAFTAVDASRASAGRSQVIVLLTDGEIGHESVVLAEAQQHLGDTRIFTIGIDTAVNQGFLTRLAKLARGTATFVAPGAKLESALVRVAREIGEPLVTDLKAEGVGIDVEVDSLVPGRVPDLFAGRASGCFFKFKLQDSSGSKKQTNNARIKLSGTMQDGKQFTAEVRGREVVLNAVPQLWAKQYVVELEDKFRLQDPVDREKTKALIVSTSKKHSILTRFTAFVVVDQSEIANATGDSRTVVQPVETPALWAEQEAPQAPFGGAYGAAPVDALARMRHVAPAQFTGQSAVGGWGAPPPPAAASAQFEEGWGANMQSRNSATNAGWGASPQPPGAAGAGPSSTPRPSSPGWGAPPPAQPPNFVNEEVGKWHAFNPADQEQQPKTLSDSKSNAKKSEKSVAGAASTSSSDAAQPTSMPLNDAAIDRIFSENMGLQDTAGGAPVPGDSPQTAQSQSQSGPMSLAESIRRKVNEVRDAVTGSPAAAIARAIELFDLFMKELLAATATMKQGRTRDPIRLQQTKVNLEAVLALLPQDEPIRKLRNFLTNDVEALINVLRTQIPDSQLKSVGSGIDKSFEAIHQDFILWTEGKSVAKKGFWESSI